MVRGLLALLVLVPLAGCYGEGTMGWGSNGTTFEVMRHHGYIEVTEVGKGAMVAVPEGASPQYTGEKTRWEEFSLQFEEGTKRVRYNQPANDTSYKVPAGRPFPLSDLATGEVQRGERLYFCTMPDTSNHRFGVVIHDSFGGYNLWFESIPVC